MNMLNRYKVLDLTDEKGMLCSKLLADMGAEVVRIEKPGIPIPPVYANTGKHSISLNVESEPGRVIFRRLIQETDVLVESFPPGYFDSLGFSYHNLKQINPGLIMASISYFGSNGPYRDKKSSDLVASALGGHIYICGDPGKPPLKPFGPLSFSTVCLFGAISVLLALWQRHTTGTGQYLDLSVHECLAATLDHVLVRYFHEGTIAERQGNLHWNKTFRLFPCQDGYILLTLFQHWDTLIEWLDSEGMAGDLKDEKYRDETVREKNAEHIITVLEQWTRSHKANDLVELGQLMRFPWAKVASIPEVVDSPQLNERGYFITAVDPDSGKTYKFPGAPVKAEGSPWLTDTRIPEAGEFNREVYVNRLKLSAEEIEGLLQNGTI